MTAASAVVIDPESRTVTAIRSGQPIVIELGLRDWRVLEAFRRTGEPALVIDDRRHRDLLKAWALTCVADRRPFVGIGLLHRKGMARVGIALDHTDLRLDDDDRAALAEVFAVDAAEGWRVEPEGALAWVRISAVDDVLAIVSPLVRAYVVPQTDS